MTPAEKYRFDVSGYLVVPDAIEPSFLDHLNGRLDVWEEKARRDLAENPEKSDQAGPRDRIL